MAPRIQLLRPARSWYQNVYLCVFVHVYVYVYINLSAVVTPTKPFDCRRSEIEVMPTRPHAHTPTRIHPSHCIHTERRGEWASKIVVD